MKRCRAFAPVGRRTSAAFALVELPVVSKRKRAAFTLVELLVVVAIIALLVTILMPSLNRALRLARRSVCMSNQHHILLGIHMYCRENNDHFPYSINNHGQRQGLYMNAKWQHFIGKVPDSQILTNRSTEYTIQAWRNGYVDYEPRFLGEDVFTCPEGIRQVKPTYGNSSKWESSCMYGMNALLTLDINCGELEDHNSVWDYKMSQEVMLTEITRADCIMIADAPAGMIGTKFSFIVRIRAPSDGMLMWSGPWPQQMLLGWNGSRGPTPEHWDGHLGQTVIGGVDGSARSVDQVTAAMFETRR
ncbi:MAG: type II secretion system protein [Planctomycetota bacterium]|jgi:prepilin-type N-terminal cleavage/methylation domain-containing protein